MYNPKIFIRGYGTPTRRMLAYAGQFAAAFNPARFIRALIMPADNPFDGEQPIMLSGDMQSGSDALQLSGYGGDLLAFTNSAGFALRGGDADLRRGLIMPAPVAPFSLTGSDAKLLRQLKMPSDPVAFAITGSDAKLLRSLILRAETAPFALTGQDANLSIDDFEAFSGDAQSGSDIMLLSGDAQTGTDFLLISR